MTLRRLKPVAEHDKRVLIEDLKILLQAREEILFAILYGSLINSESGRYGDVDVALYVKPEKLPNLSELVLASEIEVEIYKARSHRGVKTLPIELLIINHAPVYFITNIFKNPYMILKGDEFVITDFIERIGARSMANYYFRQASLREMVES